MAHTAQTLKSHITYLYPPSTHKNVLIAHTKMSNIIHLTHTQESFNIPPLTNEPRHISLPGQHHTQERVTSYTSHTHQKVTSRTSTFLVQPNPLRVTFSNAVSKLKAQTPLLPRFSAKRRSSFEL